MPMKEFVEGAVKGIADAVDNAKPDVPALRQKLADRAGQCLAAAKDGDGSDPWLVEADTDTVAFSPLTASGHPILINGKTTTFWSRDDVVAAISNFHDAITHGAFDDQLVSGSTPTISLKIEGEQRPVDPENGSMTTGGGRTDASEIETRFTEHLGDGTAPQHE